MITIKEIADLAGVSTATVSRVINERGGVKEKTYKKISNIIKKHNYVVPAPQKRRGPKLNQSTLLKYRNFTMIWPGGSEAANTPTGQAITFGISEAMNAVGASLTINTLGSDQEWSNVLYGQKTDGVFLCGRSFPDEFLEKVKDLPVIWLLQVGPKPFGDRVQPDHEQVGRLAFEYLYRKGCRRICCVSCKDHREIPVYWQSRETAFLNMAKFSDAQCTLIDLDYTDNLWSPLKVKAAVAGEAVARMKQIAGGCDGIFIANNLGTPICSELLANRIIPMKDIEVVAGDFEVCGGYLNPEPVRINIRAKEMGRFAFDAMMWRLQHPEAPGMTYLQAPALIIPDPEAERRNI